MRIAIVNWSNRQIGGTGTYLRTLIPALAPRHDLAFLHELDAPSDIAPLALPDDLPRWNIGTAGIDAAVGAMRAWAPDLLFVNGLLDPAHEAAVLDVAPAVLLAHDYYGTCISGRKAFGLPVTQPCDRAFGPSCLVQYFPRRCGGRSPVTMVREYRRQAARFAHLARYRRIVTISSHLAREYSRYGLSVACTWHVREGHPPADAPAREAPVGDAPWRVLFVGRTVDLKGGRELIAALPAVAQRLGRRLHLTVAGDGAERQAWQQCGREVEAREPRVTVAFPGWLDEAGLSDLFATAHLLAVPSLWPEPLGLVGLEAGRYGVPAVAYAVGGIPDWLHTGVNGVLAPGDPPTVAGLAEAIVAAVGEPGRYARLSAGARRVSADNPFDEHVKALLAIFDDVVDNPDRLG
jgi:glycosyltransferase involved in cell wall biosynthesis